MNVVAVLRRAFAANPHKVPVGDREAAVLEERGIRNATVQTYFVWRRSLMMFVVLATLVSAGLATYREYAETDDEPDAISTLAERFSVPLEDDDDEGGDDDDDAADEQKTAFAEFADAVELISLYLLPIAALAVVVSWTRFQLTYRIMQAAFALSFLVPMLIAFCPWSWWGVVEVEYSPQTQPLEYLATKAEGLLEGAAYLAALLPTVLSLVPGVQRACIRVKLLLPQSMLPGFFLVAASPFYALFLLVIFVAVNQFDTHPLFFVGMLLFLAAPLTYAVRSDLFTRPLASEDDYRRIRNVQRLVGAITALSGVLIVTFLATREALDIRLLGTDYQSALLVPLDVVEFLLETISRSMFITVLGADLFLRMNHSAWKHARDFVGSPEAESYDRVMEEFSGLR